jgi:hypothetical protein
MRSPSWSRRTDTVQSLHPADNQAGLSQLAFSLSSRQGGSIKQANWGPCQDSFTPGPPPLHASFSVHSAQPRFGQKRKNTDSALEQYHHQKKLYERTFDRSIEQMVVLRLSIYKKFRHADVVSELLQEIEDTMRDAYRHPSVIEGSLRLWVRQQLDSLQPTFYGSTQQNTPSALEKLKHQYRSNPDLSALTSGLTDYRQQLDAILASFSRNYHEAESVASIQTDLEDLQTFLQKKLIDNGHNFTFETKGLQIDAEKGRPLVKRDVAWIHRQLGAIVRNFSRLQALSSSPADPSSTALQQRFPCELLAGELAGKILAFRNGVDEVLARANTGIQTPAIGQDPTFQAEMLVKVDQLDKQLYKLRHDPLLYNDYVFKPFNHSQLDGFLTRGNQYFEPENPSDVSSSEVQRKLGRINLGKEYEEALHGLYGTKRLPRHYVDGDLDLGAGKKVRHQKNTQEVPQKAELVNTSTAQKELDVSVKRVPPEVMSLLEGTFDEYFATGKYDIRRMREQLYWLAHHNVISHDELPSLSQLFEPYRDSLMEKLNLVEAKNSAYLNTGRPAPHAFSDYDFTHRREMSGRNITFETHQQENDFTEKIKQIAQEKKVQVNLKTSAISFIFPELDIIIWRPWKSREELHKPAIAEQLLQELIQDDEYAPIAPKRMREALPAMVPLYETVGHCRKALRVLQEPADWWQPAAEAEPQTMDLPAQQGLLLTMREKMKLLAKVAKKAALVNELDSQDSYKDQVALFKKIAEIHIAPWEFGAYRPGASLAEMSQYLEQLKPQAAPVLKDALFVAWQRYFKDFKARQTELQNTAPELIQEEAAWLEELTRYCEAVAEDPVFAQGIQYLVGESKLPGIRQSRAGGSTNAWQQMIQQMKVCQQVLEKASARPEA